MGTELYGVRWRNFKLALTVQKYLTDPVQRGILVTAAATGPAAGLHTGLAGYGEPMTAAAWDKAAMTRPG